MATIAIVASPNSYMASLGAMLDAHARLGELFENNVSLGAYAKLSTEMLLISTHGDDVSLAGGRRFRSDISYKQLREPRLIYLPSFQLPDGLTFAEWEREFSGFHQWLREWAEKDIIIGGCGASVLHLAATACFDHSNLSVHPSLKEMFHLWYPQSKSAPLDDIQLGKGCISCAYDSDAIGLTVQLLSEAFSPTVGRGLAMRSLACGQESVFPKVADPLVEQAQMWIREHFTHDIRIADLANKLDISHQSLIRRFRKEIGATPKRYIQSVRVDTAAIMLQETRRSVAEIAQLVGYVDVPSFRRAFVGIIGVPPNKFRQQRVLKG